MAKGETARSLPRSAQKGEAARKRQHSEAGGALDALLRQAHNRAKVQGVADDLLGRGGRQAARQAVGQAGQGRDKGRTQQPADSSSRPGGRQVSQAPGGVERGDSQGGRAFPSRVREQLDAILADPTAPAATRGQAARTLAEMDGLIGRHQAAPDRAGDTPTGELSRADLLAELTRLRHIAAPEGG
jgi:hypothetical protein